MKEGEPPSLRLSQENRMRGLKGRVVVITGAAGGIGRALVEAYLGKSGSVHR